MPLKRVLEPEVMSGAEEADEYDAMDFSETDRLFAERAAEMGGQARWIVDLGAGNAKISLAVSERVGARVCAVDMSQAMLAVAAKHRGALELAIGDAKRLPFADGSIDVVMSNSLIHHIPDPREVFREVARIGRRVLIRDLIRPESEAEIDRLVTKYGGSASPLQRRLFSDSFHAALTLDEARALLDETGLAHAALTQITDRHWSAEVPS